MTHNIDEVTARWQRRNAGQRFELWFATFTVSEMMPGTIVYDRLRLAIALQRFVHAIRAGVRSIFSRFGEPEGKGE